MQQRKKLAQLRMHWIMLVAAYALDCREHLPTELQTAPQSCGSESLLTLHLKHPHVYGLGIQSYWKVVIDTLEPHGKAHLRFISEQGNQFRWKDSFLRQLLDGCCNAPCLFARLSIAKCWCLILEVSNQVLKLSFRRCMIIKYYTTIKSNCIHAKLC